MERKITLGLGLVALVLLSLMIVFGSPWALRSSAAPVNGDLDRNTQIVPAADKPAPTAQTGLPSEPPTATGEGTMPLPIPNRADRASGAQDVYTEEALLIDLYDRVSPSVVHIAASTGAPGEGGTGTGWVLDAEGRIVTNNHVVEDADQIAVRFADGEVFEAELLGADADSDLAVGIENLAKEPGVCAVC